jgi:hypothetical protein
MVEPLRNFIKSDDKLILVKDKFHNNSNDIYNAFMCSIPNNILFKYAIDKIVYNVINLYYPNNLLLVTGPALLRECYDMTTYNLNTSFFDTLNIGLDYTNHNNGIFDENRKILINKCYKRYYKNDGGGSYVNKYYSGLCYSNLLELFTIYNYINEAEHSTHVFEFNQQHIIKLQQLLITHKIIGIQFIGKTTIIPINNIYLPQKFLLILTENNMITDINYKLIEISRL